VTYRENHEAFIKALQNTSINQKVWYAHTAESNLQEKTQIEHYSSSNSCVKDIQFKRAKIFGYNLEIILQEIS
jgi:hypothetical protein